YLFGRLRVSGPDPEHRSYRTFASFSDPDGNGWLLQEITTRLPGRGLSNLDVLTLTDLLLETEHWSGWYAAYIVARQDGNTLRSRQTSQATERKLLSESHYERIRRNVIGDRASNI